MMPMWRQPEPAAWREKERTYLGKRDKLSAKKALHDWQHENRKLARWFHDEVRPLGEPSLCAYCDGQLDETSPKTIDHFLPEEAFPEQGLSWHNLYPACSSCNTVHKRTQWSCHLLRPDADLISSDANSAVIEIFQKWFDFEPSTGALSPAPGAPRSMRARVRLTIRVFGLNEGTRCKARKERWRYLIYAMKHPADHSGLDDMVRFGPYRFVAVYFRAALQAKL